MLNTVINLLEMINKEYHIINEQDLSPQQNYISSLTDPRRREFASEYLVWSEAGINGLVPPRGGLTTDEVMLVVLNLEAMRH